MFGGDTRRENILEEQKMKATWLFSLGLVSLFLTHTVLAQATSTWVSFGPSGTLQYHTDANGNKIMDFSSAGYKQGGVALPVVRAAVTISPIGGDNTANIQSAINTVSGLTPDADGFRGAVVLNPGTYNISSSLNINASGVVLRGSGSGGAGQGGTTINMTGTTGFLAVNVDGSGSYSLSNTANFVNQYVPSGTNSITVTDASGFSVGDDVLVQRTVTQAWIHLLGMDTLVRNGVPQTWIPAGTKINTDRTIAAINGNTITLDAPLTDSFDPAFLGNPPGTISKYTFPGRISQVAVEHLQILAPIGTTVYNAVSMSAVKDGWVSDVVGQETQNAFNISSTSKRITFDHIINDVTTTQTRSAGTADFDVTGSEVLVSWCQSNGTGDWPILTAAEGTGPIVILNFYTTQKAGISPHQRWTTGVLADSDSLPNPPSGTQGIAFRNRGTAGSGQGWTTGWAVAWNVITPFLLVSEAPGTDSWCIGCIGTETTSSDPQGIYDSLGTLVTPDSLYLEQLRERLGNQALANIGDEPYDISASPSSGSVAAGSSTSFTVDYGAKVYTLTDSGSGGVFPGKQFTGVTAFSVSGLPSGASASFSPGSLSASGNTTMKVTTASSTPAATYPLSITASSAHYATTTSVTLVVGASRTLASYEAEASGNTFSGSTASAACSGCSGGMKVRFIGGNANNFLVINNISVPAAGNYTLTIYYVVSGTRSFSITVNGGAPITFTVSGTTWNAPGTPVSVTIPLNAGNNSIKFFNNSAFAPDMDRITIQ
jgi:hypothetical protein